MALRRNHFDTGMSTRKCINCLQLPPTFLLPQHAFALTSKRSIKSISKPTHSRFSIEPGLPQLGASSAAALKRKAYTTPLRTGALGTKKGMSAVYDVETGKRHACTVLQMDRVQVVAHKTKQQNGYWAVQVGSGWKHPSNITRPLLGHYARHQVSPKRHLVEFKVRDEQGLLGIGETIGAGWFQEGQYVDAKANSRGMGFAGGMKRHGFKGQPASHGVSLTHRAMGSAGQSQGGGSRVLPGKKMPGRMGGHQVTQQNIKVVKVNNKEGIVVLNGTSDRLAYHTADLTNNRLHTWSRRLPRQAFRCYQETLARHARWRSKADVVVEPLRALANASA